MLDHPRQEHLPALLQRDRKRHPFPVRLRAEYLRHHFVTDFAGRLVRGVEDREEVNRALEQPEKGRVLYCRALPTKDLLAALAYHLPRRQSERILIRCLAVRTDAQNQHSAFCALLLKVYAHEVARQTRPDASLDLEVESTEAEYYCRRFGFTRRGVASDGRDRLRQEPFQLLP